MWLGGSQAHGPLDGGERERKERQNKEVRAMEADKEDIQVNLIHNTQGTPIQIRYYQKQ